MIDILAPLALLAMIGLVVAIFLAARKQRQARGAIFESLAASSRLRYLSSDDGTAEAMAEGFEGFGRFYSPSAGKLEPKDVVMGELPEGRMCAFTHRTREVEGEGRQWCICIIDTNRQLCESALIRPRRSKWATTREVGVDPEVSFTEDPSFSEQFFVRSKHSQEVKECLNPTARELLVTTSSQLPFGPEVQIRQQRLAVYPTERNVDLESEETLSRLVELTRKLSRALTSPAN